jgi:hypothetical protein
MTLLILTPELFIKTCLARDEETGNNIGRKNDAKGKLEGENE